MIGSRIKKYIEMFANGKKLLFAIIVAIILTVCNYMMNNMPLFTGENLDTYTWLQYVVDKFKGSEQESYDDALFVNVAYDKQLVESFDEDGMPQGVVSVTDREKLKQFLRILRTNPNYRYILLDVRFEKGIGEDEELFNLIKTSDRIIYANQSDLENADSSLLEKAGYAEYYSTITATNFARYYYLYKGDTRKPFLPLKVYLDETNSTITKNGPFYFDNGRLCNTSVFLHFESKRFEDERISDEGLLSNYAKEYSSQNLGVDILEASTDSEICDLVKGKYVVIGDFVNDMHDTYAGMKPGPLILYKALKSLQEGKHLVSIMWQLVMLVLYFIICISMLSEKSLIEYLPFLKKSHSKLLHFVCQFVGISMFLMIFEIIVYSVTGVVYSFLLPAFVFALIRLGVTYKRYKV